MMDASHRLAPLPLDAAPVRRLAGG
jgi:hypothetical protein